MDARRDASPPIVLLANDQEWSARSLESVLGPHGYASVRAYTGRQAIELARRTRPDVVIIDAGMPDISGIEVCRKLREDIEFPPSTPILITTAGPAGRQQRLAAHQAGAWEFLSLPVDADALILKLGVFVQAKREIDRSRDAGLLDASTGLYNVRGLARRAREIGAEATRRHTPMACIAIATVPAGDATLIGFDEIDPRVAEQLSELCRRTTRSSDAIGRIGRSEFAIVAPTTDDMGAVRLVERLRESVESTSFLIGDSAFRFKIRAGYCAVRDFSTSAVDAVEVLLRASTALRHARTSDSPRMITAFEDVPVRFAQ
jgi:diguanylate cyclase (GGDEF)-like protein